MEEGVAFLKIRSSRLRAISGEDLSLAKDLKAGRGILEEWEALGAAEERLRHPLSTARVVAIGRSQNDLSKNYPADLRQIPAPAFRDRVTLFNVAFRPGWLLLDDPNAQGPGSAYAWRDVQVPAIEIKKVVKRMERPNSPKKRPPDTRVREWMQREAEAAYPDKLKLEATIARCKSATGASYRQAKACAPSTRLKIQESASHT